MTLFVMCGTDLVPVDLNLWFTFDKNGSASDGHTKQCSLIQKPKNDNFKADDDVVVTLTIHPFILFEQLSYKENKKMTIKSSTKEWFHSEI